MLLCIIHVQLINELQCMVLSGLESVELDEDPYNRWINLSFVVCLVSWESFVSGMNRYSKGCSYSSANSYLMNDLVVSGSMLQNPCYALVFVALIIFVCLFVCP
jgi:hypothetical protein